MTNPNKTLLLLLVISMVSFSLSASSFDDTVVKLNPDFKLKRMNNGTVVMSALRNGETIHMNFRNSMLIFCLRLIANNGWDSSWKISPKSIITPMRNAAVKSNMH